MMSDWITKDDLRQFQILLLHEIGTMIKEVNKNCGDETETEWLKSRAIRRIMDISPGTLQNLRVTRKVRVRKVMGSYYYNKSDVMKLFDGKDDESFSVDGISGNGFRR